MEIDWIKHHRFQIFNGWCGPAIAQMVLSVAGIYKPQWLIGLYIWKWWWGSPYSLLISFLNRFFTLVNYKTNGTIADISTHLKLGHIVIINWYDKEEGHYSIVSECKKGVITLIDPSRERNWQWKMTTKELKKVWYDTLDMDNRLYHERLLIWVDPLKIKY